MSQIAILGRQPALGLAELESLYGADVLSPAGEEAVRIELGQTDLDPSKLGGVIKLAKVLAIIESTDWRIITKHVTDSLPHHLGYIPDGKIKLGISVYGLDVKFQTINAYTLSLKTIVKRAGRSVRIITNKSSELNSAQVQHGGLLSTTGVELLLIADGTNTILAQTHWVQDIDSYRKRDQERPKRDARVGMLPPKLGQMIINIGAGSSNQPCDPGGGILLDPFCGTGVILQEALLMGYIAIGTDLDPRMVSYSKENLQWLQTIYPKKHIFDIGQGPVRWNVNIGDATRFQWDAKTFIACETYLGRPLSSVPDNQTLQKIMSDGDTIHRKFLKNVANQTSSGFRLCIAVPAWHVGGRFKHLRTLDSLEELGYNRIKFVHAHDEDLIYRRPDQIVARELVVLERK